MALDTISTLIALGVLCCSFSIAMLLIWRFFAPGLPLLLWSCGMGCCGLGIFLVSLRDTIPRFFSITVANLLIVGCYCLVWWGICIYRESKPFHRTVLGSLLLFVAIYAWFTYVDPDIAYRMVFLRSFIVFYLACAIGSLLKTGHGKLTPMEKVAVAALLTDMFLKLLIAGTQLLHMSYRAPLHNNVIASGAAMFSLIGATSWGLAVVLMTLEKTVADMRTAENSSRFAKNLLETIIDNIPALIYLKDCQGRFLACNMGLANLFGVPREQIIGKTIHDFFPAELAGKQHADDMNVVQSGRMLVTDEVMELADGRHMFETTKLAVRNHAGETTSLCGISSDITERIDAQEKIKEKNNEIEQFTYTVSHDLRSPLVTVRSFLGYLEQDMKVSDTEKIEQDLGFIRAAADKMDQLLKELLEMSRIGRHENPATPVTFQEVVREALASVAGQITGKSVVVQVADVELTLTGDRPRLEQIWQNLLDNAVKYLGDQPAPRVELGVELQNDEMVFFVRDNGIGIAPEYRDRIFGMFDKLDKSSAGVGLGLAMVKKIVEKYDGKIWVESNGEGCGACFRFTLPGGLPPKGDL